MQRLFEVSIDDQAEADRVLEKYLKKRVKDLLSQSCVDCVKEYYRDPNTLETIDDAHARPIQLQYEQYLAGRLKWCSDEVWPRLCAYWCTDDFKLKRARAQECRFKSQDIAQNHGGSRPFTETQQFLV